jgi:hypothetical protein
MSSITPVAGMCFTTVTPCAPASAGAGVSNPRLLVETAKSEATQAVLDVVDESLDRSAKALEEREKRDAEERREQEARERVEQAETAEARDAERMRDRVERQAEDIARHDAQQRAQTEEKTSPLYRAAPPFDVAA